MAAPTSSVLVPALGLTAQTLGGGGGTLSTAWTPIDPFASVSVLYVASAACTLTFQQSASNGGTVCDSFAKALSGAESSNFVTSCTGLWGRLRVTAAGALTITASAIGSRIRLVTEEISATITGPITLAEDVTIDNWPTLQPVSVSNFPDSQPVTFATAQPVTVSGTSSVAHDGAIEISATTDGGATVIPVACDNNGAVSVKVKNADNDGVYVRFDTPPTVDARGLSAVDGSTPVPISTDAGGAVLVNVRGVDIGDGTTPRQLVANAQGALFTEQYAPIFLDSGTSVAATQSGAWSVAVEQGADPLEVVANQNGAWAVGLTTGASVIVEPGADALQVSVMGVAVIAGGVTIENTPEVIVINEVTAAQGGTWNIGAVTSLPILTGTNDGTTARKIKTDVDGQLIVDIAGGASISVGDHPVIKATDDAAAEVAVRATASGHLYTVGSWHTAAPIPGGYDFDDSTSGGSNPHTLGPTGDIILTSLRVTGMPASGFMGVHMGWFYMGENYGDSVIRFPIFPYDAAEKLGTPIRLATNTEIIVTGEDGSSALATDHIVHVHFNRVAV